MIEENYFDVNEMDKVKSVTVADKFVARYDNSTEKMLMSPNGYLAAAVALFLIGFFGFFLNFTVLLVMIKEKSLRTPFNTILLNLICSDFSVSILGNPITFTAAVYRKWIFGRTICVMYGFFMSFIGIAAITTITILSFERYLNIAKPFHSRAFTIEHSKRLVCGIWIYSFSLTSPPLFGWGEYVNESANISCSVNWEHKSFDTMLYIVFLFVMGLGLPVCVIFFSYANIVLILLKKKIPGGRVRKVEVKVIIMIAVMVAVFLLAWTPYAVVALIVAFWDPAVVTPAVSVVPAIIAKSSICYNPIIYAGLNSQIRTAGMKLFGMKRAAAAAAASSTGNDHESHFGHALSVPTEELLSDIGVARKCDKEMSLRVCRSGAEPRPEARPEEETTA